MKNKLIIGGIIILCGIGGYFYIKDWNTTTEKLQNPSIVSASNPSPTPVIPADSLEVIHFHATQQCPSCIAVGKYALQTLQERFPEEVAFGKITFQDINVDLKENQDIVVKYQAGGSSLFINAIRNGKDDISEDVTVWRLVNNESQYITYFEGKIKSLLGK